MSTQQVDSFRADHAWKTVESVAEKRFATYRSRAREVGLLLRQCGLLQLAATWYSRTEQNDVLLQHVFTWLTDAECPVRCAQLAGSDGNRKERLRDGVRALFSINDARKIRLLEREAEAYAEWLKRWVDGRYAVVQKETRRDDGEERKADSEEE